MYVRILYNVSSLICHIIMAKHYVSFIVFTYLHTIGIDQVTGVNLTCEPMDLINQCTVMWNVSSFLVHYHYVQ